MFLKMANRTLRTTDQRLDYDLKIYHLSFNSKLFSSYVDVLGIPIDRDDLAVNTEMTLKKFHAWLISSNGMISKCHASRMDLNSSLFSVYPFHKRGVLIYIKIFLHAILK